MKRVIAGLLIVVFTLLIAFSGCREKRSGPDVSGVEIAPVDIHRYERALFNIDPDRIRAGLDSIHSGFSLFLGEEYEDTLNILRIYNFITDPKIRELNRMTKQVFPDLATLEDELGEAFRYWKHYFPSVEPPEVYTYISGLYYEAPVEYFDSVMIISLDLFLGADYEPYRTIGLSRYMVRRMTPDFIVPECMKQIGIHHLPADLPQRTLLDHMVLHGKLYYFLDHVMPGHSDTLVTGYTPAQQEWCRANEEKVWALMLEGELLFSPDPFVVNKFIQDGPFTSGLPPESPAMLGRWMGWQIVNAYMERYPETSMEELFHLSDSQHILSESRYKPSRK